MREYVSSVTSKGQVTIPVEIRKLLGVGTPDKVAFVVGENGHVAMRPVKLNAKTLRGIVPAIPGRVTGDFEEIIKEAMEAEADRIVASMRER